MATHDELDWNVNPAPRKKPEGDINLPGYDPRSKKENPKSGKPNTGVDSMTGVEPVKPPEPEIRFVSARFEPHPVNGYAVNQGCVIDGKAEFLTKTNMTRCTVELFSIFEDEEQNQQINPDKYGTAYIDTDTGEFRFDNIPLYIPFGYPERESFKTPIRYKAEISSARCEKPLVCYLDLPDQSVSEPSLLKKGMYDDKGVEKYPDTYRKGGDGYVEGTPVHEFQKKMEAFRYLPPGSSDGVFGPRTDTAARNFQTDSRGRLRVDRPGGKLIEAASITFQSSVDGVVGPKTRREIEVWESENFLRPLPNLYYDDYDREAVSRGVRKSGRGYGADAHAQNEAKLDDYHDLAFPVLNAQKELAEVDAYIGDQEGWFGDKMKFGIERFQECAADGTFVVGGTPTTFDEKLTGHQKGVFDIPTREMLQKVKEKGGKVPPRNTELVFYAPSTDEYVEIDAEAVDFISEEAETSEELARLIQSAWTAGDFEEACTKAQEAEKKLETVLGAKTQMTAKDTFEELIVCRLDKNKRWGKPIVYARKDRLRDRISGKKGVRAFRRSGEYEKRELAEFMAPDSKKEPNKANPLNAVKANFWKTEAGGEGAWAFTARDKDGNKDVMSDDALFSASAEAQLLRFAAGASISSDVTSLLKGKPKFSIGGQGHVSFSLVEGTADGSLSLPNKNGFNILSLFENEKLEQFVHDGRACNVLFKVVLTGYGFVGANASAVIGLPQIDFSQKDGPAKHDRKVGSTRKTSGRNMNANAGGEVAVGATATAGGSLACTVEWKGHDIPNFAALGEVKGCAEGSAGAAIQIIAQAGLIDGEFCIRLGAKAVVGLGGKLGTEIALGIDEGYKFLSYLLYSVDSHYVAEFVGNSFQVLTRKSVAVLTDVNEAVSDAMGWGKELVLKTFTYGRERGIDVKEQMVERLGRGAMSDEVKYAPAESRGFIILGIMEIPEAGDHDAILAILRPAGVHTLKSILRVIGAETDEIKSLPKPARGQADAYGEWQGKALQAGIKALRLFGTDLRSYKSFVTRLMEMLNEKRILLQ
jgi:hypothetical protein